MTKRQQIQAQVTRLYEELNEGDKIMYLSSCGKHIRHGEVYKKMYLNGDLLYKVANNHLVHNTESLKFSKYGERRKLLFS